jgi:hypothetical protein
MFHCFATWYMKEVTLTESGHKPEIKLRILVCYFHAQWQAGHSSKLSV